MSATLASLAMNTTLSLSVMACSIFVIGTLHCLGTMLGQWFSSCGKQISMGLLSLSQIV